MGEGTQACTTRAALVRWLDRIGYGDALTRLEPLIDVAEGGKLHGQLVFRSTCSAIRGPFREVGILSI